MKIRFIINPISGTGNQKDIDKLIARNFHNRNYEIYYTKKPKHATVLSAEAVKLGIDSVVAIGGDGTVNECMKPIIDSNTALGIIPCGSGNGFAIHLGINKDPAQAILQLKKAKKKIIDTGTVNDESFVNVSGIGFDAHIANLFANSTKRGFINYIKLTLKELRYKPKKYLIQYDGIERQVMAYAIVFANASQYGNNARISPKANINDGLLDFVIIRDFPNWKIPFFVSTVLRGKTHLSKKVEIIRTKKMKIESDDSLVHLDGEPKKMNNIITVKVRPKSLKILTSNE